MRSFVFCIVILMAVPALVVAQQRNRSEQSATGRTAVRREQAVQAAPARQPERRAESHEAARSPVVEQPSLARLIFDIHPATAQVFVDGYFIGIPEDF